MSQKMGCVAMAGTFHLLVRTVSRGVNAFLTPHTEVRRCYQALPNHSACSCRMSPMSALSQTRFIIDETIKKQQQQKNKASSHFRLV